MAEQENETESNKTRADQQAVSRRRLLKTIGGAATVGAGMVLVGEPVPAGASGTAIKTGTFSSNTNTPAVSAVSTGTGPAVRGSSRSRSFGSGVFGMCVSPDAYAVAGVNSATSGLAIGVAGQTASSQGSAVTGLNFATSGSKAIGVYGQSASPNGAGVEGFTTATSGTPSGVYGESPAPGGYGVSGANTATSGAALGVQGLSASPDGYAVAGVNNAKSGRSVGVYGETGNTDTGFGVLCKGRLAATSTIVSGFLLLGTTRTLYSMASPECWIEDFGSADLVDGAAKVPLDPAFAAAVRTDSYNVFVVPEGDCRGLYVAEKGQQGFTVRELQGGKASVPFSYRVVARRQDVDAPRLAEVDLSPLVSRTRDRAPRVARPPLLA
jgi:hypothetical protein